MLEELLWILLGAIAVVWLLAGPVIVILLWRRLRQHELLGRVIRIKVFAKSFEAADRLTEQLAASEPFELAKVDGEVKASRKREGKTFTVTIPLGLPGEES